MSPEDFQQQHEEDESPEESILMMDEAAHVEDSEGVWLISYADLMTLLMGFFALMLSMASFDEPKFDQIGEEAAKYFGGEIERAFDEVGAAIEKVIQEQGLQDRVKTEIKKSEVTVTFEGTLFFESGSIQMKSDAQNLMRQIIDILGDKAKEEKFLIEGHTDDVPISQGVIASNWELSSLRAGAVARLFETRGFQRQQIMTIGYGDTRPIAQNRDEQGSPLAEGRKQNRRVVLKVMRQLPL